MRLFLDCDGVLADFERRAGEIFGMPPRAFEKQYGLPAFWRELARASDFYATLPLLPGARRLFEAVQHLDPILLTGCPRGGWAEAQKVRWADAHFPGTRIITCMAVDKRRHGRRGDVLVDDMLKHRHLWEAMGGTFVLHRGVDISLAALHGLGFDVRDRSTLEPGNGAAGELAALRRNVAAQGTSAPRNRFFSCLSPDSLEEESIMAQNDQQGGNQSNQNSGQQEQQDQQRRQPGQDDDRNRQNNQAGRDDENRQDR